MATRRPTGPAAPAERSPVTGRLPVTERSPLTGLARLTRRSEFVAAAKGRRFHTDLVSVQGSHRDEARPGLSATGVRAGITVTKREGHATERNRIRRRLRAALRSAGLDRAEMPVDLVVIGRRAVLSAEFRRLVEDLGRALPAVSRPTRRSGPGPGLADGPAQPNLQWPDGRSAEDPSRAPSAAPTPAHSRPTES